MPHSFYNTMSSYIYKLILLSYLPFLVKCIQRTQFAALLPLPASSTSIGRLPT
ncbi:hypothetical protein BDV19DRAFT_251342 [Aspergillus venezuelensis]